MPRPSVIKSAQSDASLPASFFARPTVEVAQSLLGQHLVRRPADAQSTPGRYEIVEVEAYTQDDPASHAFNGPSKRSSIMFGPPGHAYVYFIYGMYHCLNAVTELDGVAGAVLIRGLRALPPPTGEEAGLPSRKIEPSELSQKIGPKLDGPGKLCRALAIDLAHNGVALFDHRSPLFIAPGVSPLPGTIIATPRIGISKAQDRPWRFIIDTRAGGGKTDR
ncbi:MAG: DNA-3-methyladenine glycosylase [Cyanobacteria bacterium REEB67]|nr:DNA-3-methyladenine glycosylase [Cyanobacteria bacterium REEB67]